MAIPVFHFVFLCRYKLILTTLAKELAKEIKSTGNDKQLQHFLRSCDKAVYCMHEVSNYVNRYTKDTEYKSSVRKFTDNVRGMESEELRTIATKYGRLVLEGQMIFKKETEQQYSSKFYLMFFQRRLFTFKIEKACNKTFLGGLFGGNCSDNANDIYHYKDSIPITNCMSITVEKVDKQPEYNIMKV